MTSTTRHLTNRLTGKSPGAMLLKALLLAAAFAPVESARAQTFHVLYAFAGGADGSQPSGSLLLHGGSLYGVAGGGGAVGWGTVYRLDVETRQKTTLYSFGGAPSDGNSPRTGLVRDPAGNLYGTTDYGGSSDVGILFRVDSSGAETVIYNFSNTAQDGGGNPAGTLVRDSRGDLYGTTSDAGEGGVVFRLGSDGNFQTLAGFRSESDGFILLDGLLLENGSLYGTAYAGGSFDFGVVFKVDPVNGGETVLYNFTGGADGGNPQGGLVSDGAGNLYGTTTGGGEPLCNCTGVVFKLNIATGQETVLYTFTIGDDGYLPLATLVRDSAGNLYGTTYGGGAFNMGTVFKLDTSNNLTTLHAFTGGLDGENPTAALTLDSQGRLYGTSAYGGAFNQGTVFVIAP